MTRCPCTSGKEYAACCKPLHEGRLAKDALELMRSRFSAYALDLADYIIATTHPASPHYSEDKFNWKRSVSRFSKNCSFQKLEVLEFKEKGSLATVTFTAHILEGNQDATFTEKSLFEKMGGKWFYRSGQLREGHAPNLATEGQLKILPLAYYGDAVLKKKGEPVLKITEEIRKLADEMIDTMDACDGVGLAAPQVHHSVRMFVIRTLSNTEENSEMGEAKVLINPKIRQIGSETWEAEEGCLSIPGFRSIVKRAKEIEVEYTNLDGKVIKERASGWLARVILHENDHIDGVLFIDRLNLEEQKKLTPDLEKLKRRIHDHKTL